MAISPNEVQAKLVYSIISVNSADNDEEKLMMSTPVASSYVQVSVALPFTVTTVGLEG